MTLTPQLPDTKSLARPPSLWSNRWLQLTAGIVGMVAVANFQYAWTLFVGPLQRRHGWNQVAIQDALFIYFVLAQTWLVPFEGYLADRFGPRRLLVIGGLLATLSWVINSRANSLSVLYLSQALGGCGSGIVYTISVGSALKWFPDRRGLAAGLTAAAFGAGSAATVRPISAIIERFGYESAFLWFGLGQGLVILLASLVMRFPRPREIPEPIQLKVLQSHRDFRPREMLRSPAFWLIYAMMTVGAVPGLLMLGQIKPIAEHYGVDRVSVTILFFSSAALPLAMEVDRIMGGLTRPVFGWVSDHIGREVAIFLAFTLEGTALLVMIRSIHDPVLFVLTSGLAFFGWGAIFSLFPAVSGDMFGRKFATTNYGLLYTAKGAAALLVALCNRLQDHTGSWPLVFGLMIGFDFLAALLALFVLRPLRRATSELAVAQKTGTEDMKASEEEVRATDPRIRQHDPRLQPPGA
jgi:OFA family oxalate/formate antiporter-like MFS transporter